MFLLVLQAASQLKLLDPVAPSLDSKGSTWAPDSVDVKKIGTGKSENLKLSSLQALTKCIWSSTKDNQIQSNSQGSSGPWLWGISVLSCLLPLLLFLVKKHFFARLKNRKRTSRAVEAQTAEDKERFFHKICVYIFNYIFIYIYIRWICQYYNGQCICYARLLAAGTA